VRDVIWKYTLAEVENDVEMPQGAQILTVASQFNEICVWARVDPEAPRVTRTFYVVGTGCSDLEGVGTYYGSALLDDGKYVFHVFERANIGTSAT
jgi:hypothetical protein